MRTAQILRKYLPREWAGTEAAVLAQLHGLRSQNIDAKIFCPTVPDLESGPFEEAGFEVERVESFLPIWGLTAAKRTQLLAVGGNLISFALMQALWREPELSLIHTHALGLFGGIALAMARLRGVPVVVSIHGGVFDLPKTAQAALKKPLEGTFNWGKPFSLLLRTRYLLRDADLLLTSNPREAELLRIHYPEQRVAMIPYGLDLAPFKRDCREIALKSYPELKESPFLVMLGRIDPVKNQLWMIEQLPQLLLKHPQMKLLLIGPATDALYRALLESRIRELGLAPHLLFIGELPPADCRLIGLLQQARALILPSLSETFGLVILEAWAARTLVIASRTSGPSHLIEKHGGGWLFDLDQPGYFRNLVQRALSDSQETKSLMATAAEALANIYDIKLQERKMAEIYRSLIQRGGDEP